MFRAATTLSLLCMPMSNCTSLLEVSSWSSHARETDSIPGRTFRKPDRLLWNCIQHGRRRPVQISTQTTEHSSCQAYQEQPPKAMIAMYQREKGNNFNWWEVQKAPAECLFSRRYRPLVCLTSCRSCYSSRIPSLVISLMLLSSHGGHLINAYFFSLSYLIIRAEISAHRCRN